MLVIQYQVNDRINTAIHQILTRAIIRQYMRHILPITEVIPGNSWGPIIKTAMYGQ